MDLSNIISLLSGTALFLFGMSLMGDGLKKVAGNRLEVLLYKLTNTSWKGILLGTGVTAVIQSSSATSAMVVGFVNSGMMKFRQAIGIILGSIIGTSITGWVICLSSLGGGSSGWIELLSTATLTGIISIAGIILRMFSKKQALIHTGDIMLGFSVLMFGMSTMSGSVAPLTESPGFIQVLTVFSNPLLGILAGALFTAVLQSASATVGILQALAITGAIDFSTAFPLIMGIAVGSAVPVLLSALGANADGKRTSFVYLLTNVFGMVLCGSIFYAVNAARPFPFLHLTMSTVSIALMNTVFRLATVVLLYPAIPLLEKLTCRLIPEQSGGAKHTGEPRPEDRFLPYPPLAIAQCREFIIAMAAGARNSLTGALSLVGHYSTEGFEQVAALEEQSDRYEDTIGTYLMKITLRELDARQNAEVSEFLHTLPDFERISDHALNIAETAQEIHQKSIIYSDDAYHELEVMQHAVEEIVTLTVDAFSRNDLRLAAKIEPLEEVIDELCNQLKQNHVNRLQHGQCSLEHGFPFNNLLVDYERVSDHCSNIALALLEVDTDALNTHEHLKNLEAEKHASFLRNLESYQQKYALHPTTASRI